MKKTNLKKVMDVTLSITMLAIALIVVVGTAIGVVATILGLVNNNLINGFFVVIVAMTIVFEFNIGLRY